MISKIISYTRTKYPGGEEGVHVSCQQSQPLQTIAAYLPCHLARQTKEARWNRMATINIPLFALVSVQFKFDYFTFHKHTLLLLREALKKKHKICAKVRKIIQSQDFLYIYKVFI